MQLIKNNGITLMSVMVATALMGVVALATMRLFVNQDIVIRTVALKDERIRILAHYRNVVIGGWDKTRSAWSGSGTIEIYDRSGTLRISGSGLTLGKNGLYQADPDGWWTVKANAALGAGVAVAQSFLADKPETIVSVKMSVSFDPEKHPSVKTKIGKAEEVVFLHNNITNTSNTRCGAGNPYHPSKLDAGNRPFYRGEGAIIQYDFKSNYTKCSQVPLVDLSIQPTGAEDVLRGFQSSGTSVTGKPQYSEEYITVTNTSCGSYDYVYKIDSSGTPHCASTAPIGLKTGVTVDARNCLVRDFKQWQNPQRGMISAAGILVDGSAATPPTHDPFCASEASSMNPPGGEYNVQCITDGQSCGNSTLESNRGATGPAGVVRPVVWPTFADRTQCPAPATCPNPALWSCN